MKHKRIVQSISVLLLCILFLGTPFTAYAAQTGQQTMDEIPAYGDVNEDGNTTVEDALLVLQLVVKLRDMNEYRGELADVDDNGSITVDDAIWILQKTVKLIRTFPAEIHIDRELIFGISEEELEWMSYAKYYNNTYNSLPISYLLGKEVRMERQTGVQCGGHAAAYIFRFMGEDVTGEEIYNDIPWKLDNGTIMPEDLAMYIDYRDGYRAQLYMGTVEDMLDAVTKGLPVIMFGYSSFRSKVYHFMDIVGYDSQYVYMVDSQSAIGSEKYYNRKVTYDQLEAMWNTEFSFLSHLFIVVEKE